MKKMICALPGNEAMAGRLADALDAEIAVLTTRSFPDGESYLRYESDPVGRDLILVCTLNDPNPKTLPLLFAAAAARDLGAASVGLVTPYLAYMRQDRRFQPGEAITSLAFAAQLSGAFDWLVTVDPHLHRYQALSDLYTVPAFAISAAPAIADWLRDNVEAPLIVGPDMESEQWVRQVAEAVGAPHAVLRKTRHGDRNVEIEAPDLAAHQGRTAVLLDDIVSSAHTTATASRLLAARGFARRLCVAVHGIFAGDALSLLAQAGVEQVVTTNTIVHASNGIDISRLLADAIPSPTATRGQ